MCSVRHTAKHVHCGVCVENSERLQVVPKQVHTNRVKNEPKNTGPHTCFRTRAGSPSSEGAIELCARQPL